MKHFHFWFIAVVLATFVIVSAASLAGLDWVVIEDNFTFTYASVVIPAFFATIIFAVRRYSMKVALTVCGILGISMMILVITSPQNYSNLHGTIIVMAFGVGVVYWIDRDRKNQEQHRQSAEEIQSRMAELQQELLERQRTENELMESRRRFRDLANLLPQIIWEIDTAGNVTFTNKQALEAFGYSIEENGRNPSNAIQTVIPEERERMKADIQKVLSGEELGGVEYTAIKKGGSTFPVLIYAARVLRDNRPIGLRLSLIHI